MILDFTQLEEEAAQKLKIQQKAADDWKCYFVFARVISLCRLSRRTLWIAERILVVIAGFTSNIYRIVDNIPPLRFSNLKFDFEVRAEWKIFEFYPA